MGYTAGRAWIEALRTDHANHILGLRLNDWTALIVFLLGLAWFVRHGWPAPSGNPQAVPRGPRHRGDGVRNTTRTATSQPNRRSRKGWTSMADPTTDLPELPNPEIHHDHRDFGGGWLRPTVFGMMDGLVSNFALIAGVAGANSFSAKQVSLAGLAGLVGGAFSMAVGEYVSVQSQNESAHAEIEVERHELKRNAAAGA